MAQASPITMGIANVRSTPPEIMENVSDDEINAINLEVLG